MTPRPIAISNTILTVIALGLLAAGCSSSNRPEDQIPDGPLVPTASLEYAANDPKAADEAQTQCQALGQTAKLDKTDPATQIFKCQ